MKFTLRLFLIFVSFFYLNSKNFCQLEKDYRSELFPKFKSHDTNFQITDSTSFEKFNTILVNEKQKPGTYEVAWDALEFSSGIYFYQLKAGKFNQTKKLVLIK